ncbi:MAG: phosphoribosyltransferase [Nitrospinae bacterium]|nr:phosphoribosyltransferase [Nitrospinota bacterium]MZH04727.1 phosphoribosyltransferase [Nitrospinota bacterium]MZH14575.1 phosphoribosyltransferase [Nitrospinota bacterium]
MFSRIIHKGNFTLSSGVKSTYTYEYGDLTDAMNEAYCEVLLKKLLAWQKNHEKFDVVVGCETEGIRIGHQLSKLMNLPFHIMPKKRLDYAQVPVPAYPADTHWLIVDDIVTTGHSFIRAVDYLEVEEKPETITFACMIKRNPANLDYSAVKGDPEKEQLMVSDERMDFIDKRLVSLFSEV